MYGIRVVTLLLGTAVGMFWPLRVQAQCYRPRTYYPATPVCQQPYTYNDNRLVASFVINYPNPAVAGNTVYGNTPAGGLASFDAAEFFRLKVNAGQRYGELGATLVQSADVAIAQAATIQQQQYELARLERIDRLVNGGPAQASASASIHLQTGGDAGSRVQVKGLPPAGTAATDAA
jgi:hypothetical protein